jgi:hypothetical protein
MEEESLSESAAIIKIVKHFFDGSVETKTPDVAKQKDQEIADLRADIFERHSSQTRNLSFFVHWLIELWITIKSISRRDDDPSISG